jgi:hypothetical protein
MDNDTYKHIIINNIKNSCRRHYELWKNSAKILKDCKHIVYQILYTHQIKNIDKKFDTFLLKIPIEIKDEKIIIENCSPFMLNHDFLSIGIDNEFYTYEYTLYTDSEKVCIMILRCAFIPKITNGFMIVKNSTECALYLLLSYDDFISLFQ